jgi:hypothetical protein
MIQQNQSCVSNRLAVIYTRGPRHAWRQQVRHNAQLQLRYCLEQLLTHQIPKTCGTASNWYLMIEEHRLTTVPAVASSQQPDGCCCGKLQQSSHLIAGWLDCCMCLFANSCSPTAVDWSLLATCMLIVLYRGTVLYRYCLAQHQARL